MARQRRTGKSPAFQLYPKDWECDGKVIAMTYEEEGVYFALLRRYWLDQTLPADPEALRLLLKRRPTRTQFARWWVRLGPCFVQVGSQLRHKRLDLERRKQRQWSQKSAEGGRKSAQRRAARKATEGSRVVEPPLHHTANGGDTNGQHCSLHLQTTSKDQDPRPTAGPPLRIRTNDNPKVVRRLVHELLDRQGYTDAADLKEDVKVACARAGVAYDADVVTSALNQVEHVREKRRA